MENESATALVLLFLETLAEVRDEILAELDGVATSLPDLLAAVNAGKLQQSARFGSGVCYSKHGFGVWMRGRSGVEIDVDLDSRGREMFDAWRVRSFAASLGLRDFSETDLLQAMTGLAECGNLSQATANFYRPVRPA